MDPIALVKVLVWPCLVLLLCLIFKQPLTDLMTPGSGQTSVQLGPLKIQKIAAAAAAVAANTAAIARKDQPVNQRELTANLTSGIEASLNHQGTTSNKSILWVDDNPTNNDYLIKAFRDLGIEVKISTNTQDAENLLSKTKYDLIISDMSRPPADEAGLDIINFIKDNSINTPIMIYAAYWASKHKGQESHYNANLITNNPSEVYSTVIRRLLARD